MVALAGNVGLFCPDLIIGLHLSRRDVTSPGLFVSVQLKRAT
jgi:hypothetical protein